MPSSEPLRVLVWRRGDALLALPIEEVVEVAAVTGAGSLPSRAGALELARPHGLDPGAASRAVVVRTSSGLAALPADEIDGVTVTSAARVLEPPGWTRGLDTAHVRGILRLPDDRLAALLDADALLGES